MKKTVGGVDNFIIPANYSGWFPARENVPEQKLSYFTEDVGLNAFYFLMNQNYPIFVPSKGENLESLTRGEYYFFIHKQLLARYYLERLANDMGEIELLSVWKPITNGFYPSMHFRNGLPFPQRENNAVVPLRMQKHIWILQDLRSRISNAIDIGFAMDTKGNHVDIYGENGLNIIGNIVQGNADSINKRFYGQLDTLARKIFGFGLDSNVKYQIVPSALQILSTSMRDPVFYSLYKGILSFYMRYKEHTPKYSKEELLCPGVKVESVTVDKLLTYFDDFDSMLNNGVSIRSQKEARASLIKARQQRLNHKPFTYHIDVNSEKNMKAIIRVFLGPKYDVHGHELDLPNNYMNFMEMDEWVVDLKMGSNKIERSSHESIFVMPDEVPSDVFYKKLLASIEGSDSFSYSMQPYGFPDRLILPKGKKEGMPYKLFVVVSPFDEAKAAHMDSPIWGRMLHDGRPMGFPFDRPVDPLHFMTPNMFLKDVVIFHKEVEQLNVPAESPTPKLLKQKNMLRLWLLGLVAVSCVTAEYFDLKNADKDFLQKQKKIYNLLYHISQPSVVNPSLLDEGRAWDLENNIDSYSSRAVVEEFLDMYKHGMLARGDIFSMFYPKILNEMEALFKLFYAANDFDIFYKTALWARINVNEGQFIFALYNAVLKRPDTKYIQLPPPYEMYPYGFFNAEVLEKAHHAKLFSQSDAQKSGEYEVYIIPANYSGWYLNREYDLENKLNYFVEDIGLNSYYFYFRQDYPFWMNSKEYGFPSYRGEEYLYGHKQLLNRYNLERISNDLPRIEDFDWQKPFPIGYYPSMTYHNGLPLPQRPCWSSFPDYKFKYIRDMNNVESRIAAAIDSGFMLSADGKWHNIYNKEGLNMLGNVIEGNADSCNKAFYSSIDILGRKILGYNLEPASNYQIIPSALESFSICMRDPAFYRLYKKIVDYYQRYKMLQKPYSKDEIIYPSLKLESFAVDKLITYFDQFDASISNGLMVENQAEAESSLIKVRQYRLNHKPFYYHIAVVADKPMKAAIRLFLGPKYDSHHKMMELPESLKYFYEIDQWLVDLHSGLNKIVRNSKDCFFLTPDSESSEIFYKRILKAIDGGESLVYNERVAGFPERLLLPKGRKDGMPFQLFLYVSPVSSEFLYSSRIWGDYKMDNRSYGFPIDKPIPNFAYDGPNMMFKDILIYHKDESDPNIPY
ncbi:hexamerin 70a [Calliopsis andreniformis]|uniref:hexamerin 70a n=1 Tax=Calliopsis andreniformis TaxID=337506 RepID=UPI003FCD9E45